LKQQMVDFGRQLLRKTTPSHLLTTNAPTTTDRTPSQRSAGKYDAIVTGPASKMAWHSAGHVYPGQTEYLAERAGVKPGSYGMVRLR